MYGMNRFDLVKESELGNMSGGWIPRTLMEIIVGRGIALFIADFRSLDFTRALIPMHQTHF